MPGVFMGYEEGAKAYRVYDPVGKRLHVTRDVVFEERRAWNWETSDGTNMASTPATFTVVYTTETSDSTLEPVAQEPEPRTPAPIPRQTPWATPPTHDDACKTNSEPQRYRKVEDIYNTTDEVVNVEESGLCFLAAEEPASVDDALADVSWKEAMEEEMMSIVENKTWELVSLPTGHRAIRLKWVFKVKKDPMAM